MTLFMALSSTGRNGNAGGVLVNMYRNRPTNYTAAFPAEVPMPKPRPSAKNNCYGCDCLEYNPTKMLLDGWCHHYDKVVRVRPTDKGFFHMQVSECLVEEED
jgi:hypothetical protein